MIDSSILITIIPPVFAAIIAYAIAKIKTTAHERIQRAKIEAEVNHKAMEMVKGVVDDMRVELKAEIQTLKEENKQLKEEMLRSREEIEVLRRRLRDSAELQDAMNIEIASLKSTIQWYERRLREVDGVVSGSAELMT
jgi:predicted RNase H-like nuclease (RuvC/YqgF family)